MKKVLSLLLAIACAFSITACGGKSGEKEARAALENYLSALLKLDGNAASQYIDHLPENFDDITLDSFMGSMPDMLHPYESELKTMYDVLIGRVTEKTAFEIKNVEGKGEEYTYTVTINTPDFESLDIEAVLTDSINQDAITDIVLDAFHSGKLGVNSSEKEILDVVMPIVIEHANEAIADMSLDFNEEDEKFVVTLQNGKWLVNAEKSESLNTD